VDADLVVRAQHGDEEAFASLAVAVGNRLHAVSFRILRDTYLAEDATQQALLTIWRDLPSLRDPARFDAWSYRLLVRACYAEGRRTRDWAPNLSLLPVDEPAVAGGLSTVVDRDQLERGFQRLDRVNLSRRVAMIVRPSPRSLADQAPRRDNRVTMSNELTPREAAERIGATTRSVQRWIAQGSLSARRVGGRWRVASDAIDAFRAGSSEATRQDGASAAPGVEPIRVLFIANRGEIATRIRRTADRLGIRVVVPGMDGRPPIDLLDIDVVVGAARLAGADALHPGFGFLSENAAFADAVEAAGIRWVGPTGAAIRAMGDKAAARRLARQLGIPIVPGYDGDDQSDATLLRAARTIAGKGAAGHRHQVLIKPAAGGGGKGMRVVASLEPPEAFLAALGGARREALASFGDDRLILERYLAGPRHVEVQLLFDAYGAGVHLGERDCSLQRRHQKVLEESPSPAVDEALRQRLGQAALKLARAVDYRSAGTCEFLLDDDGEFHFLEMNTRLQVEHPVTELITGRDLVANQLRIAAGEPLGFDQATADRVRTTGGHAIEVRLYAEDPDSGFLPSIGRVEALEWPTAGAGRSPDSVVRVDAGIELGSVVDTHFDPMLAKLIVCGPTRGAALELLTEALAGTLVLGLVTNLHFLRWLVAQPAVQDGGARIDTLERIWPPAAEIGRGPGGAAWQAAAVALVGSTDAGWRLNGPARVRLEADGVERTITIERPGDGAAAVGFRSIAVGDGLIYVDDEGRSVAFRLAPPPDVDRAARAAAGHAEGGLAEVLSPMPGNVLAVHVAPGTPVDSGQPLVTIEAMKMEHVVTAPTAGTVAAVLVQLGVQVNRGQALVALTAGAGRATVAATMDETP
jgi:excisionase family DNA binding protein